MYMNRLSPYNTAERQRVDAYFNQLLLLIFVSAIVFGILFTTLIYSIPHHHLFEGNRVEWLTYSKILGPLLFLLFVGKVLYLPLLDKMAKEKTKVEGVVEQLELKKRWAYRSMLFWDKSTPALKEYIVTINSQKNYVPQEEFELLREGQHIEINYSKYGGVFLSITKSN